MELTFKIQEKMWIVFNFPGKNFEQVPHASNPRRDNIKPNVITSMQIKRLKCWTYLTNLHKNHWISIATYEDPRQCISYQKMSNSLATVSLKESGILGSTEAEFRYSLQCASFPLSSILSVLLVNVWVLFCFCFIDVGTYHVNGQEQRGYYFKKSVK